MIKLYLHQFPPIVRYKEITFWLKMRLKGKFCSQIEWVVRQNISIKFCPYFSLCELWLILMNLVVLHQFDVMIKQYLNFMFKSLSWWKIITFWHKVMLKGESGRVQLNDERKYGQKLYSTRFTFQPNFHSKIEDFSSNYWFKHEYRKRYNL